MTANKVPQKFFYKNIEIQRMHNEWEVKALIKTPLKFAVKNTGAWALECDSKKGFTPMWCYLCLWVLAQPCLSNYSIPIDLSLLLLNPFFFSAGSFILCKNFWTENVSLELQTPQPIWIMFWLSVWKINLDQSSMILTI